MSSQTCVGYPEGFTFADLTCNLRVHNVMQYGVVTVDSKEPISQAVSLMVQKNLSGLPVTHEGLIAGMLSDKDLLKSYHEAEYLPGLVEDYMTGAAISYDMEAPLSDVWECLNKHTFRHVPILLQQRPAGMITRSDLIRVFLDHARAVNPLSEAPQKDHCLLAEDAMKCGLACLPPDATLANAMDMMVTHHVTAISIVNSTMELMGLITEKDILLNVNQMDVMTTKTEDCMTRSVITFGPKSTLDELCEYLLRHDFHQLPIVSKSVLVGTITRSDILRARIRSFKK
jgi:CBS domain-containing protein